MIYSKKEYIKMIKEPKDYKLIGINILKAFLGGGIICLIGEFIRYILINTLNINELDSNSIMIGIMILLAAILSAAGIYDKVGQIFKAGSVVPITGFSNSMVSSTMEYHPEGFILGVGANAFKLAGSVIALGVLSGYIVGLIKYMRYLI